VNGLVSWWARNSVAANLLMVACLVGGAIGFLRIEREVFPTIAIDAVQVSVAWPGAAPQEIEQQVVLRIEEAVADIDGIDELSATAFEGSGSVQITVDEGVDFQEFLDEVKGRVDGISQFPADAFPPVVREVAFNADAAYIGVYGDIGDLELSRLAEDVRDELAALPGGSPLVSVLDARNEEITIEVSEVALQRYGLTFDDVARAVRGGSINRSAGSLELETGNIQVRAENLADNREEFARIVVRQTADGGRITVGDVATVKDGLEEIDFISRLEKKPVVSLQIRAPEQTNVVGLSKAIERYIEKRRETLPPGVDFFVFFDSAELYFGRIDLVSSNAVSGLILVVIILLLFLRATVAFWVAAGIVVSFAGTFFLLPILGVSLNMLSLFAFLLVLGVVVDDAIVVGESIHRQVENGGRGADAAVLGAQLVAKPVVYAVITTMIAFAPWLFISGATSDWTRHITLTIIASLSFSIVESFLILPAHLAHMKPIDTSRGLARVQSQVAESLLWVADKLYRPLVELALKARYATVALFVMMFAISVSFVATGWVPFSFFPEVEGTFLQTFIRMPDGTPYKRNLEIFDIAEDAGGKLDAFYQDKYGKDLIESFYVEASPSQITIFMGVAPSSERPDVRGQDFQNKLREYLGDIPDAEEIDQRSGFQDTGPALAFGIEAADLDELRAASQEIQDYLVSIPGVYDVSDNLQAANEELRIILKPGAERFDLTLAEVSRQVRQAYFGEEAQRLPREGEDVRVMVRFPREDRQTIDSLYRLRVRTPTGDEVPLQAVADIEFAPSYTTIRRLDRKRSAVVYGRVRDGVESGPINREFYENFVPEWKRRNPGVDLRRRGQSEAEQEFFAEVNMLYMLAFLIMYGLIAVAFNSYWQPLLIMTAIPFGYMGAVFGHLFTGVPMALFSFFGIAAAAGVVVNDDLVLIDYVNRLRRQGAGAMRALVEAGVNRFRPIFLTSLTTFIGLVPIMLEDSFDAQFLMPTVVSLAFGVLFATIVTLVFVPAMYAVGADIARFARGVWTGRSQDRFGEGASASEAPTPDLDALDFGGKPSAARAGDPAE